MNNLTCVALAPALCDDYFHFFETRAFTDNPKWVSCYCYFPIHDPQAIQWHKQTGSENRKAVSGCIANGTTSGFLAYLDGKVVGWCNAGPWTLYPMLRDEPEPNPAGVGVVSCFLVAPESRGKGVATALLAAACDGLRAQGMKSVQTKPLKVADGAAANHLGPLSMYLAAGFHVVRETPEGDVYVRESLA